MASTIAPRPDDRWPRLIAEHHEQAARRAAGEMRSVTSSGRRRWALLGALGFVLAVGSYLSIEAARWYDPHRCDEVLPGTPTRFWSEGWGNGDGCVPVGPDGEVGEARYGAGPPVHTRMEVVGDNLPQIGAAGGVGVPRAAKVPAHGHVDFDMEAATTDFQLCRRLDPPCQLDAVWQLWGPG